MPLLRITCPADWTERIVAMLDREAAASEVAVMPRASRVSGGDLILAEVPRGVVDDLLARLPDPAALHGIHVAVQATEQLFPTAAADDPDDEAVIWAQVDRDVHEQGRLSWVNVLLVVVAAMLAAVGIVRDELLLIVGAMALSPDYFPVADTCLSIVLRRRDRTLAGLRTLAVSFGAGIIGAWLFTEAGFALGLVDRDAARGLGVTQFISQPDMTSVVVALLAGVAGALAITLQGTRGLVGVFVSITTIPAAANIGVAAAARDVTEMTGAAVQLGVNVASLLLAGTLTLELRHHLRRRRLALG